MLAKQEGPWNHPGCLWLLSCRQELCFCFVLQIGWIFAAGAIGHVKSHQTTAQTASWAFPKHWSLPHAMEVLDGDGSWAPETFRVFLSSSKSPCSKGAQQSLLFLKGQRKLLFHIKDLNIVPEEKKILFFVSSVNALCKFCSAKPPLSALTPPSCPESGTYRTTCFVSKQLHSTKMSNFVKC